MMALVPAGSLMTITVAASLDPKGPVREWKTPLASMNNTMLTSNH